MLVSYQKMNLLKPFHNILIKELVWRQVICQNFAFVVGNVRGFSQMSISLPTTQKLLIFNRNSSRYEYLFTDRDAPSTMFQFYISSFFPQTKCRVTLGYSFLHGFLCQTETSIFDMSFHQYYSDVFLL